MSNDLCIFFMFMSRRMQRYLRASDGGFVCSFCDRVLCFVHLRARLFPLSLRYSRSFLVLHIRNHYWRLHNLNNFLLTLLKD